MDDFELILKNEFLDEASQSLADSEQCFLLLENDPNNIENLNKIFRLAHNLKGSSKAVGFMEMSAFTHEFETFILKLKNGELSWNKPIVNLLLECNDHLVQMVNALRQDHSAIVDSSHLLQQIQFLKENIISEESNVEENPVESFQGEDSIIENTISHDENSDDAVFDQSLDENQRQSIEADFEKQLQESLASEENDTSNDLSASSSTINSECTSSNDIEPNLELLNELLGNLNLGSETTTENSEKVVAEKNIKAKDKSPAQAVVDTKLEVTLESSIVNEVSALVKSAPVLAAAATTTTATISTPPTSSGSSNSAPALAAKAPPEESIRISVSKLELLLNHVGEMVILQTVLREQALKSDSLFLKKTVQQLGKVSKEIQDLSMSLRMVSVKPTFQKMQRIVRDTANVVNKEVQITLIGEDTELDKTVLEKLNDPLVHLIRNSVDHGIESGEQRIANGKNAKGNVTLSAAHRSGKLVIEVKDDGAGLDPERLKNKAIEKGILKPGSVLTEKEAFNLIFAPGFSTKEQVTDVSGRGVGMDVVKTNIHELSGDIQIFSEKNKGTTFQIVLPLTLAIIDGMVVTFAQDKFVIPLNQIYETIRPSAKQIQNNQGIGQILMLRDENLPLFRLGDFFAKQNKMQTTDMIALIIRTSSHPYALLVDDILGQYQVVTKRLGPELQDLKGVSGSTILGDGKPALILETQDLIKRNRSFFTTSLVTQTSSGSKAA